MHPSFRLSLSTIDLGARLDLNGTGRGGPGVARAGDLSRAKAVGVEPTLRIAEGQLVRGEELTSGVVVINGDDGKDQD